MGKKSVLMTVQWLCGYSGSELHCLAMAEEFIKRGYTVTIAVFKYAYPISKRFEDLGATICSAYEKLPEDHYDILFTIHYPVVNYVVSHNRVTFDRVATCILSAFHPLEHFPGFAEDADIYSFVSREAMEHRVDCGLKLDRKKAFLFVNYADDSYFEAYSPKEKTSLKKIAVVSNHVCPECLSLKELAEEQNIEVEYLGLEFCSVSITPELLKEYDLVITIGKTVQFCMAAGVPVYCYDLYGGCGYITSQNFERNRDYNFSGRGYEIKRTGEELFADILNHYADSVEQLEWLHHQAEEQFSLSRLFDRFLTQLMSQPARTRGYFDFYNELEKVQQDALAIYMPYSIGSNSIVQIYEDLGEGFSEENSHLYEVVYQTETEISFPVSSQTKALRFDPDVEFCRCKILSVSLNDGSPVQINPVMPFEKDEDWDIFFSEDGKYLLEFETESQQLLTIKFIVGKFHARGSQDYLARYLAKCQEQEAVYLKKYETSETEKAELMSEREKLLFERNEREQQISLIKQSLSWRLTKPLRAIKKLFSVFR